MQPEGNASERWQCCDWEVKGGYPASSRSSHANNGKCESDDSEKYHERQSDGHKLKNGVA